MPQPEAVRDFYERIQRLQLVVIMAGRRAWSGMRQDFDASWSEVSPGLVTVTTAGQLAAARAATEYVPALLAETEQPDAPDARVRPQAFAGVASDGRSLPGLLQGAVVASKRAVARGLDGGDALLNGQRWLEQALQTAIADAARDATAAETIVRPRMGWVRVVNAPCCSRCAVLGGRFYQWHEPLRRHPQCDCLNQPTTEADSGQYVISPQNLLERGLITDLSQKQRARLDDGANLNKVLNESRDRWRERMAADRRAAGPVDRLGRSRPIGWNGGGTNPPPVGTTIHDLMARLTSRVEATDAMRAAGIAT